MNIIRLDQIQHKTDSISHGTYTYEIVTNLIIRSPGMVKQEG